MDVSEFVAAFGRFYKEGNTVELQKLADIIFTESITFDLFNPKSTNSTVKDFASMSMTRVLQAFQPVFTTKGNLKFTPNSVKLFRMKVNQLVTPDEIRETAADYLGGKGLLREQWQIAKLVGTYLLLQSLEDYEVLTAFKGKYVAPTSGVASVDGTEADGLRWQISVADDEGKTNKIISGAPPTDSKNYVKWIEDWYKSIPLKYRAYISEIFHDQTRDDDFIWGSDELYNSNYDRANPKFIKGTNIKIVGLPSMSGSSMLWATPQVNRVGLVKDFENKNVFAAYPKDVYNVQIASDWSQGLGVKYWEMMFHNEQDLQVVP